MELFDRFFLNKKELLDTFQNFALKYNLKFIRKLKAEKSEDNFLSKITEIHFGCFFGEFASSIREEPIVDGKTPDWIVTSKQQDIIVEVLRLNPSQVDQLRNKFVDDFVKIMKEIKISAFLKFSIKGNIDVQSISLIDCKNRIENWLQEDRIKDESFCLSGEVEVTFIKYNTNVNYVCCMFIGNDVNSDHRRLYAQNSQLIKKVTKYSNLIQDQNNPYIICVYLDFHTGFDEEDLFRYLYGVSCEDVSLRYSRIFTSLEHALYYSNEITFNHVSGILLRHINEYYYFHNFSKYNLLNESNKKTMMNFQYYSE